MKKMKWKKLSRRHRALGIYDLSDKYPSEISGGQQQRTAAARAFVHQPSIILQTNQQVHLIQKCTRFTSSLRRYEQTI